MNNTEQHLKWQNRKVSLEEINRREQAEQTPTCEICHCLGNQECGHEYLDQKELCTLQPDMICPCCKIINNKQGEVK